ECWAFVAGPMQGMAIYLNGDRKATQTGSATRTPGAFPLGLIQGIVSSNDAIDILFFAVLDAEWPPAQVREWAMDPYGPIRMAPPESRAGSRLALKHHLRR